jgi:universal stress protein E
MMQRLDRILAVVDPTSEAQVGVGKAAQLAQASGATLELFACDFDPALTGQPFFDTEALRGLRDKFVAERQALLDRLAGELRTRGLEVTTHVHWDNPLHKGILRRVEEFTPDLVVKDTHHHSPLRRTLLSNTDWTLIRKCPVPLLLAKEGAWPGQPRIVAALDPGHHGDKPAALDADILEAALRVGGWLGGQVEAVHAFFPAALLAATTGLAGMPLATDAAATELVDSERQRVRESIRAVARDRLPADAVKVLQGAAADLLPRHAEQVGAALVVMGAVSRSRLRELFVGSTAERVLDRMPCDVLVVKPPDFRRELPF